jgi:hypothetical protein
MCYIGKALKTITVPQDKPLIGYRAWNISLASPFTFRKTNWGLKKIAKAHSKPTLKGETGLYCFKTSQTLRSQTRYAPHPIHGIIHIWGTIVVHEYGYRASHATIVKITKGKENLPATE